MHRGLHRVLAGLCAGGVGTGYTVFEAISPTGILSRALIYGRSLQLLWVAALLLFEVVYSRRAWCRYACPIGLTYGVVGVFAPVRVKYSTEGCFHEGDAARRCARCPMCWTPSSKAGLPMSKWPSDRLFPVRPAWIRAPPVRSLLISRA